jgi:hypothetical protein
MKKLLLIPTFFISATFCFTACSDGGDKAETTQLAKGETYTCTMHNEVLSDHSGECPKCGMTLVKQRMTAMQQKLMREGTYVKPKQ